MQSTSEPPGKALDQPITSPVFIMSCLLLPVLWGVVVHMLFNKLRRDQRPPKLSKSGWPDYQI